MKKLLILSSLLLAAAFTRAATSYFTAAGSIIALLDSAGASIESARPDDYTNAQTPFDRAIRFDNENASAQDYLKVAAKDVQDWPADEQLQLKAAFAGIDAYLGAHNIRLHLPDTVKLIKTSGKVEFGAEGWTRRDLIMLNTGVAPIGIHILAHELFHVLSRNDARTRDAVYAVFHFRPCNNIEYKPALDGRAITNPDCPYLQHYIRLQLDGKPQDAVFVLYSKQGYHKGFTVNDYMNAGLLALTGDDRHKAPLMKEGKPVIYQLEQAPDLFSQIGRNTQYLLHVEEVSAENFAALAAGKTVKEPAYLQRLEKALQEHTPDH